MSAFVPLGRVVRLVAEPADESTPAVAAEVIEGGVGRLLPDREIDVDGMGTGFRSGDVLFGKLRPYLAKVWLADQRGRAIGDLHVYRPSAELEPAYLRYCLLSNAFISPVTSSTFGAKMPRASWDFIKTVPIYVPPLPEQRAIADCLDRETAKIDTLIEKQTTMIERLRERREAVIRHGATCGIDHAPLNPSNTWTGAVPEGWRSLRVSWMVNSTGSGTTPPNDEIHPYADGLVPWVNTSELREHGIRDIARGVTDETLRTTSALRVHPAGTVLMAMYGATIGRLGWLEVPAATNQACLALIGSRHGSNPRFLVYAFRAARGELLLRASGGGQPNINADKVRSLRIPAPPATEQRQIADYLDRETAKIDALITKVERHIELAKERRAALITAVVTGQIDVTTSTQSGDAA